MRLGHWIGVGSLPQTTSALGSLAALLPDEAERVQGEQFDMAIASAGVILAGDHLRSVLSVIEPSKRSYRKVNLWWSVGQRTGNARQHGPGRDV